MTTVAPARVPAVPGRLDPRQARDAAAAEGAFLLDVRGYDEFAAAHAAGALCIPLPDLERRAGELPTDRPIVCLCASGGRSQMAAERLRALGMRPVFDVIGGTKAWEAAGLPVRKQRGVVPVERQVRGVAGVLVFGSSVLGFTLSPAFHGGAAFFGFMLAATALAGICPMMLVLKRMPWNRVAAAAAGAAAPACAKGG